MERITQTECDREQANNALKTIRNPSQPLRRKNAKNGEGSNELSTMLLKTRIKNEIERGKLLETPILD